MERYLLRCFKEPLTERGTPVMFTSPSKLEKIKAQFNTAHSKDQT
jgi:hypothetical protein